MVRVGTELNPVLTIVLVSLPDLPCRSLATLLHCWLDASDKLHGGSGSSTCGRACQQKGRLESILRHARCQLRRLAGGRLPLVPRSTLNPHPSLQLPPAHLLPDASFWACSPSASECAVGMWVVPPHQPPQPRTPQTPRLSPKPPCLPPAAPQPRRVLSASLRLCTSGVAGFKRVDGGASRAAISAALNQVHLREVSQPTELQHICMPSLLCSTQHAL